MIIPQSPLPLLDMRFEDVNGVAEFRETRLPLVVFGLDKFFLVPLVPPKIGERTLKRLEKIFMTPDTPEFQQGGLRTDIFPQNLETVGERPGRGLHIQAGIPHRITKVRRQLFQILGVEPAVKKHQIDIGIAVEFLPPVAPQGHHARLLPK